MASQSEPATLPDETSFHAAWVAGCTDSQRRVLSDSAELALTGGAMADRLAWVFVSGYQAAVRQCFPELVPATGWTCLAAAEGRGGPGCALSDDGNGYKLSGEKSWIAGAAVLESLVVSTGEGEERTFAGVLASAPGVSIDLPRKPGFLGEMSQGVARFADVSVAGVLQEPARGLRFRGAEPLFVMLALNACLRVRAATAGMTELVDLAEQAIVQGRSLPAVLDQKAAILAGLAEFRSLTSRVVQAAGPLVAEHPTLAASWDADARLFAMFGVNLEETAA